MKLKLEKIRDILIPKFNVNSFSPQYKLQIANQTTILHPFYPGI